MKKKHPLQENYERMLRKTTLTETSSDWGSVQAVTESDYFEDDDFVPTGHMQLTNTGGIEVEISKSGDGLRYRYSDDDEPKEAEIEYFTVDDDPDNWPYDPEDEEYSDSRPGFEAEGGTIYYLDEFMRTN